MTPSEKPLPCPWCGEKAKALDLATCDGPISLVRCDNFECHASGPSGVTKRVAVYRWNTRKATPAQGLEAAGMREALKGLLAVVRAPGVLEAVDQLQECLPQLNKADTALSLPPSKAEEQGKAYGEAKVRLLEDFDLLWEKHDRINGGWGIEEYMGGLEHIIMNFRARMRKVGL